MKATNKWEPKAVIPANVDPIKLADKIKGDISAEWLKRRAKLNSSRPKHLLAR